MIFQFLLFNIYGGEILKKDNNNKEIKETLKKLKEFLEGLKKVEKVLKK